MFWLIAIVIAAVLCWLGVIPLRKWYYLLKNKLYGKWLHIKLLLIKLLNDLGLL